MNAKNKDIKFIDLFAGIGGFRIPFESLGCNCVFTSENDTACQDVYFANYHEYPHGDITTIDAKGIPDFDILCAGFPCQPFSVCGRLKGFNDTRGTLFFEICRIASEKRPKVILLENVKNITKHDSGRTFNVIMSSLESIGYNVSYKVLNASNFGVPQNRERTIIVASLGPKFDFDSLSLSPKTSIRSILEDNVNFTYIPKDQYTILDEKYVKQQPSGLIFCGYLNKEMRKNGVRPNTEHLSRAHRQPNRIYSIDGVHPTLMSQETNGRFWIYIPEEDKVRKLTLNECYRLMGFPDTFIKANQPTIAYAQCGNAVVIPMVKELASKIINQYFI